MPKMKTHSGAAARFRVTGRGKLMRRHAMRSHLLAKKNSKRLRRLGHESELSSGDRREARRLLGL
ncbi:MAG: 50S ribosomal protein L35 [Actinobacteria bacterium]|jgi:large subunit ribosomal protein L35|nr:50S ribosomal protein L35 [Actinomycetota bacterium]